MRFLWKSQLKKERGKFLPRTTAGKSAVPRKERLESHQGSSSSLFGVSFLWLLFFGTLGYALIFSSYLALAGWRVQGLSLIEEGRFQETVDQELAQRYLGFIPRGSFFLIQPTKLERFLKERYPLARNIVAKRVFPDRLEITVEERDRIILWCVASECGHVLEDGSVVPVTAAYEEEGNRARTLYLRDESSEPLRFGSGIYDAPFMLLTTSLQSSLQAEFGIETENEMMLASRFANELRVKTKEGWGIYFSTRIPIETSLQALRLLFEREIPRERFSELEYIDLRTENRVFYRYRNSETKPSTEEEAATDTTNKKDEKKSKE